MALASGIDTSIKLFLMTAIYTEKQNGRHFHAREHRLVIGDARELKKFGEHSPSSSQTQYVHHPTKLTEFEFQHIFYKIVT